MTNPQISRRFAGFDLDEELAKEEREKAEEARRRLEIKKDLLRLKAKRNLDLSSIVGLKPCPLAPMPRCARYPAQQS